MLHPAIYDDVNVRLKTAMTRTDETGSPGNSYYLPP
ncbi:hypothetical protein [Coxiella burnetii]|uniref:Uncharacterized protein n=2 Tax=Coxiella burnetii TaxID=777 RepID=B5QSC4_COXBU|nr:hypothetical protein [Coxiella burnetii]YP_002332997.1 hypothetical protein CBU_1316a [Coxiella burnetii RSA 493]ACI15288.1 hypothetical protein CBU_1316a [Coxiella burnetii RSA 493]ARI66106.1 hypothetical protein B7L74_06790 [Coxiella burnetii]AZV75428.1 hypothetical protein D6219_06250 [Coxiella burnetii]MCF2093838.1 hypothetical protein [Coxiella burnetii]MCF2095582.1 hypothetical protein [Coxiella burnetii]